MISIDKKEQIRLQPRFRGIFDDEGGFDRKIRLSSKAEGIAASSVTTSEFEVFISEMLGVDNAIALDSSKEALKAGIAASLKKGYDICGHEHGNGASSAEALGRVFCSNLCPKEQANAIIEAGGTPVFIDVTSSDYNMDPDSLEAAFDIYPDTRVVVVDHLYGFPAQIQQISEICKAHDAVLVECVSEGFGATSFGRFVGTFGDISILDFGKDGIISAGDGGVIICNDDTLAQEISVLFSDGETEVSDIHKCTRDLAMQGSSYTRMSDVKSTRIMNLISSLDDIIQRNKQIYEYYRDHLSEDIMYVVQPTEGCEPNYHRCFVTIESSIEPVASYNNGKSDVISFDKCDFDEDVHGATSPEEVAAALDAFGAEAGLVYTPMNRCEEYKDYPLVTPDGLYASDSFFDESNSEYAGRCGICLPVDASMSLDEQDRIIDIVHACFDMQSISRQGLQLG